MKEGRLISARIKGCECFFSHCELASLPTSHCVFSGPHHRDRETKQRRKIFQLGIRNHLSVASITL